MLCAKKLNSFYSSLGTLRVTYSYPPGPGNNRPTSFTSQVIPGNALPLGARIPQDFLQIGPRAQAGAQMVVDYPIFYKQADELADEDFRDCSTNTFFEFSTCTYVRKRSIVASTVTLFNYRDLPALPTTEVGAFCNRYIFRFLMDIARTFGFVVQQAPELNVDDAVRSLGVRQEFRELLLNPDRVEELLSTLDAGERTAAPPLVPMRLTPEGLDLINRVVISRAGDDSASLPDLEIEPGQATSISVLMAKLTDAESVSPMLLDVLGELSSRAIPAATEFTSDELLVTEALDIARELTAQTGSRGEPDA